MRSRGIGDIYTHRLNELHHTQPPATAIIVVANKHTHARYKKSSCTSVTYGVWQRSSGERLPVKNERVKANFEGTQCMIVEKTPAKAAPGTYLLHRQNDGACR